MNKRIVKTRNTYTTEFEGKLEVNFYYNETSIFSDGENLIYQSICLIDAIDGSHEANRYTRPDILTIQGILCFFSGYPFTVYENISGHTSVIDSVQTELLPMKLIIDGVTHTEDLKKLLFVLNNTGKKTLIISLLDRWRKARYMENESEVNTYHDEAILAYFHILELIASEYSDEFKTNAESKINSFITDFCSNNLKLVGSKLNEVIASKSKILKEILISAEASINIKMYHFLEKYSMLDEKSYSLINRLTKVRNSIAHGRTVFKDKFIWPLPPFFISTNESHIVLAEISMFTARVIAKYLDLEVWKEQWEQIHDVLPPSEASIKDFIRKIETKRISITTEDFIKGKYNFITPSILTCYFIENMNKNSMSQIELILGNALIEIEITKENAEQFFLASVLLADSCNDELSSKSKFIVEVVHSNNWIEYSNIKDIFRYLNYYDIQPIWFRSWLEQGGHIRNKNNVESEDEENHE